MAASVPDHRVYRETPLAAIHPEGWIRAMLVCQRDGLTGHLEAAGYPFNTGGWTLDEIPCDGWMGKSWWPYEQVAYWVDGMVRCGHLLRDPDLLSKAGKQVSAVLDHPARDGYLGPSSLREAMGDRYFHCNRWPHAVLFRAVMAEHSARPRKALPRKVARHYRSGGGDYSLGRNLLNVEPMVWAARETGDARLLALARAAYDAYQARYPDHDTTAANQRSETPPKDHGVNYIEHAKLGAILYGATGDRDLLEASRNAIAKLERDHGLVTGVPSATEHLRGIDALAGSETCTITDLAWTLGYLLMATGEAGYADRIERVLLNAAPGSVTKAFTALQYFSGPNQVVADHRSNHHLHATGGAHISYRPNPGTECCPGNVNRMFPAYASRMWLTDRRGGVTAALYGPGRFVGRVGRHGTPVTIHQETAYPFRETVVFRFHLDAPVTFPFGFRIPGWCARPEAQLNGRLLRRPLDAGTFVTLNRTFRDGDTLTLTLPMPVRFSHWPGDGMAVERGPLVYALPVAASRRRDVRDKRSTKDFPAWNLTPAGPWNVGIFGDTGVTVREHPVGDNPWDPEHPPVTLEVTGCKLPEWRLSRRASIRRWSRNGRVMVKGPFVFTPPLPGPGIRRRRARTEQTLTLVPYGATLLRLTVFPRLDRA